MLGRKSQIFAQLWASVCPKVKLHKTLPGSAGLYDEPDTAPEASASPASPADAAPSTRGFLDDAALEAGVGGTS